MTLGKLISILAFETSLLVVNIFSARNLALCSPESNFNPKSLSTDEVNYKYDGG